VQKKSRTTEGERSATEAEGMGSEAHSASGDKLGTLVLEVGPGGYFGELALMYHCPRAATVRARDTMRLFAIDSATFTSILRSTGQSRREDYLAFLHHVLCPRQCSIPRLFSMLSVDGVGALQVPVLQGLSDEERGKVADVSTRASFISLVRPLPSASASDQSILLRCFRLATIRGCATATGIPKLATALEEIEAPFSWPSLNPAKGGSQFTERCSGCLQVLVGGEYIIRQGETEANHFHMLFEGSACIEVAESAAGTPTKRALSVSHSKQSYERGDYFGELALIRKAPRSVSVIAQQQCTTVCIDRAAFLRLLGPVLDSFVERSDSYVDVSSDVLQDLNDLKRKRSRR
jgi:CRP-like cAMP-binding protein